MSRIRRGSSAAGAQIEPGMLACRWSSREHQLPVARVYILETFGSSVGGIAVTLLLAMPTQAQRRKKLSLSELAALEWKLEQASSAIPKPIPATAVNTAM